MTCAAGKKNPKNKNQNKTLWNQPFSKPNLNGAGRGEALTSLSGLGLENGIPGGRGSCSPRADGCGEGTIGALRRAIPMIFLASWRRGICQFKNKDNIFL